MISMNKAMVIGVVASPPTVQSIKDEIELVGLSILTLRRCREIETKEYHHVVVSHPQYLEFAAGLDQGFHVYIEGELHTHFWQDDLYDWHSLTKIIVAQETGRIDLVAVDRADVPGPSSQVLESCGGKRLFALPDAA